LRVAPLVAAMLVVAVALVAFLQDQQLFPLQVILLLSAVAGQP
jgi:uncharacterized integral membrane protein